MLVEGRVAAVQSPVEAKCPLSAEDLSTEISPPLLVVTFSKQVSAPLIRDFKCTNVCRGIQEPNARHKICALLCSRAPHTVFIGVCLITFSSVRVVFQILPSFERPFHQIFS